MILLTAFSTLSLNMFLPSLASIAEDFDASYATVSLAVGGYLAVTAIVQLIVGPMSDQIGRRPVLLGALVLFTLASIGCAVTSSIWTFLAFRMLQGGIISGYALALAIVRDTNSERKAAGLIGYISMSMAIAPMLGPVLGGVLDTAFGWRANFYFYAISGIVLLVLCWIDLGETKPRNEPGTSVEPEQFVDLLREPLFWAVSLCSATSIGAFYIFLTGAPLVAQTQFGASTAEIGFFLGTITAGFFCGAFISARFAPRFHPTTMMLAGRLVACLGLTAGATAIYLTEPSPTLFFGSTVFVGLGNGITTPSSNAAAVSVRPKLAGSAAGLNGALVVALGAILTTGVGSVLPATEPALPLMLFMLTASVTGFLCVLIAIYLSRLKPSGSTELQSR
ncbi:MAG: multidrug effflux MFS transporter [Pseudomonadota bacterium]